jgi:hypothetical protein
MVNMIVTSDEVAEVIREVMGTIRSDVAIGSGPEIEADAVLLGVADGIAAKLSSYPGFDKAAFMLACDLEELIPSEQLQRGF